MSGTPPRDSAEQRLDLALPRHFGNLVHSRDQHCRSETLDLFIDDPDGHALTRSSSRRQWTEPILLSTEQQCPTSPTGEWLNDDVAPWLQLRPAPGTCAQLGPCTCSHLSPLISSSILDSLLGVDSLVGRRPLAYPEADPERSG